MKKRGFTLIELLAVIVILAIIALIATPAVLNIIEDSRKSAAEASARNIMNAAKTYYMSEIMNGRTVGSIDLSTGTLKYDGDQASKGDITFTDGKPGGTMYIGGYCVTININGNVSSEKKDEDECEITVTPSVTYRKYADGTELLYDPVNNVKCTDSQVETNYDNYKAEHEHEHTGIFYITGLNSGCMKWYAFLDSEDSSTVKLILDHNTSQNVAWNENRLTTPDTANAQLQTDVTNWTGEAKSSARLISATEVNQIAPLTPFAAEEFYGGYGTGTYVDINEWSQTNKLSGYYLHTGTNEVNIDWAGTNKYAWLFDNTAICKSYGCNVEDVVTDGYWTNSYAENNEAWNINTLGCFCTMSIDQRNRSGIRPVIEVSKTIFE